MQVAILLTCDNGSWYAQVQAVVQAACLALLADFLGHLTNLADVMVRNSICPIRFPVSWPVYPNGPLG